MTYVAPLEGVELCLGYALQSPGELVASPVQNPAADGRVVRDLLKVQGAPVDRALECLSEDRIEGGLQAQVQDLDVQQQGDAELHSFERPRGQLRGSVEVVRRVSERLGEPLEVAPSLEDEDGHGNSEGRLPGEQVGPHLLQQLVQSLLDDLELVLVDEGQPALLFVPDPVLLEDVVALVRPRRHKLPLLSDLRGLEIFVPVSDRDQPMLVSLDEVDERREVLVRHPQDIDAEALLDLQALGALENLTQTLIQNMLIRAVSQVVVLKSGAIEVDVVIQVAAVDRLNARVIGFGDSCELLLLLVGLLDLDKALELSHSSGFLDGIVNGDRIFSFSYNLWSQS